MKRKRDVMENTVKLPHDDDIKDPKIRKIEKCALPVWDDVPTETPEEIDTYYPFTGTGLYVKLNNEKLPLKDTTHRVSMNDLAAKIETTQLYLTPDDAPGPVEIMYKFAISNTSTLVEVTADMLDRKTQKRKKVRSVLMEKEQARIKYDDVIAEGGTGGLMEVEKNNTLSLSLGNVPPATDITLSFTVIQELIVEILPEEPNVIRNKLVIQSMQVGKDHAITQKEKGKVAVKNTSVEVIIQSHYGNIKDVECPHHDVKKEKVDLQKVVVSTKKKISNENDFDLTVCVETNSQEGIVAKWLVGTKGNKCIHSLSAIPNFKKNDLSSEMIIILDRSGSMRGPRIKFARNAIKLFLSSLNPEDGTLFNIHCFGNKHRKIFPGSSVELNEANFEEAMRQVDGFEADMGCTKMLNAIKDVFHYEIPEGYARNVFLFCDGADDQPNDVLDYVCGNCPPETRFFTFAIGAGADSQFLNTIANTSYGFAEYIEDGGGIQRSVMRQLSRSYQTFVSNVKFGYPIDVQFPVDQCNTLLNLKRHVMYNVSNKMPRKTDLAAIEFQVKGSLVKNTVEPTFVDPDIIHYLTGKKVIDDMEKAKKKADYSSKKFIDDGILKQSLEFGVLSSRTAFVMAIENEDPVTGEMKLVNIPTVLYTEKIEEYELFEDLPNMAFGCARNMHYCAPQRKSLSFAPTKRRKTKSIGAKNLGPVTKKLFFKVKIDLNPLLTVSGIKGVWTCNENTLNEVNKLIGSKEMKMSDLIKENQCDNNNMWMTAIIVYLLEKKFSSEKTDWRLIVEKSMRAIKKEFGDTKGGEFMNLAKIFVEKYI